MTPPSSSGGQRSRCHYMEIASFHQISRLIRDIYEFNRHIDPLERRPTRLYVRGIIMELQTVTLRVRLTAEDLSATYRSLLHLYSIKLPLVSKHIVFGFMARLPDSSVSAAAVGRETVLCTSALVTPLCYLPSTVMVTDRQLAANWWTQWSIQQPESQTLSSFGGRAKRLISGLLCQGYQHFSRMIM